MKRLVLLACVMLGLTTPALADEADFFRGKTVALSIGTGAGGGYDSYGRLVGRHLGRHIPGGPNVVVQNMPGASSLVLTNFLFSKAQRDGTAIGVINQAMPMEQLLQPHAATYDANRFNWIGRVTSAVETGIVWHTSPIQKVEDALTREIIAGGTGPTSSTVFIPYLLNNLAGTKYKVITGFNGTNEIGLAMERGEVEASGTPLESLKSYRAHWVRDKKIRVLTLWSAQRDPEWPDVPNLVDLGRTDEVRRILHFYGSAGDVGRSIVAPPGLALERVATLRRAFDATLKDPAFRDDAARGGFEIKPMTGEALQAMIVEIASFPKELIGKARAAREGPK